MNPQAWIRYRHTDDRIYQIRDRQTDQLLGVVIDYGIRWMATDSDGHLQVGTPTRRDSVAGLLYLMGRQP